jgi:hypothetical protein
VVIARMVDFGDFGVGPRHAFVIEKKLSETRPIQTLRTPFWVAKLPRSTRLPHATARLDSLGQGQAPVLSVPNIRRQRKYNAQTIDAISTNGRRVSLIYAMGSLHGCQARQQLP